MAVLPPPQYETQPPKQTNWIPADLPECRIARIKELHSMGMIDTAEPGPLSWNTIQKLSYDTLTGIPSTRLYEARIDYLLKQTSNEFAVAIIDCQRFELINKIYGREATDGAMQLLSRRLLKLKQPCVFIARLQRNRFGLIINESRRALTDQFFAKLEETLNRPMRYKGHRYQLSFAVGINWRNPEVETRAHEFLLDTEDCLDNAKKHSKQNFVAVVQQPQINNKPHPTLASTLNQSLRDATLSVHVEPVVNLRTGIHYSYQAQPLLLDNGEAIPFNQLMNIAEGEGLMLLLTEHILRQAIKEYASMAKQPNYLCIRVSKVDLSNTHLMEFAAQEMKKHGVPEHKLQLEVHQEVDSTSWRTLVDDIFELEQADCPSHFKRQPLGCQSKQPASLQVNKVLWLPSCILRQAKTNEQDKQMLRTTVDLARSLRVDVMVDNLNDQEVRRIALELGILYGKGSALANTKALAEFSN